jgi:secreted Zn-dependent insulinase-like peptidase
MEPVRWIFDEVQAFKRMSFNNLEKQQGMNFTSSLAQSLQDTKIEEVLAYRYSME